MSANRPETVTAAPSPRSERLVGSSDDLDDLRVGLDALSGLAMGRLSLTDTLTAVATFAVQAVPGADGAGLTLREDERADVVVATSSFVAEVDAVQREFGQGPCLTALTEGRVVRSGSLGNDEEWRRFGSKVARMGVHSVLALPLQTAEGAVGVLDVYAHAKHAFDERAAHLGRLFAVPASIAVQNARELARATRSVEQLERALEERGSLERAVGILMSRSGCTREEGLERLRQLSQDQHVKLTTVADSIVDEAVRRARARRSP
ncbi:ANTAR domain-containing protein [Desertihabitans brevis]|uniref:ANTAR domain-containing protein n=1 Tax=Desertihabitans brevis TaxID=2268447 RepID=A0A367YVF1_9ACTN|nr:GAF and ANTAR domain-containing protein [Desertihabitans brevis]RCK69529.1 ANTAR domain-containing protein [Desertihabitans brevis]